MKNLLLWNSTEIRLQSMSGKSSQNPQLIGELRHLTLIHRREVLPTIVHVSNSIQSYAIADNKLYVSVLTEANGFIHLVNDFIFIFRPFEESDDDVDKNSIEHEDNGHDTLADGHHSEDPLQKVVRKEKKVKNKKKAVKRRKKVYIEDKQDSDEMPVYLEDIEDEENDSDKLFLLSFYPELKKLPPNIKMWARAQIANIMEEAVTSHFNNSTTTMLPVSAGFEGHSSRMDFKRPMRSSSEISDVIM